MTTEKEFWEFAGRYFRTLTSIQNIIDELKVSGGLSKDVRAIKAMKRVENVMKEFDEQKPEQSTIKQQNQTLLRISAELDAIKQCDPFDLVLTTGSIENISNVIEGRTEPIINEECVGCCRVQRDTELIERLSTEIHNRDKTIKELSAMVEAKTKSNQAIIHDKNIIIDEKDKMLEKQGREILGLRDMYDGMWDRVHALEVELSVCKEDSAVLMKVVEIIRDDTIPNSKVPCMICNLVDTYLDAPEGPPETSIDDLYKVTVTYAFLEMP